MVVMNDEINGARDVTNTPAQAVEIVETAIAHRRDHVVGIGLDGAERTARDLADMILARAGALGMPHAMVRIELQNTPRPLFRETEAIVRREIGASAWHIRLTAPGDLLDPLGV
jgi:hypothetical protein